ncbi:MAG: hypothetical protein COA58_13445 [Bacteroidetes bacterium]|nr:MAG: hypothetical protein COA58_13445 [Bacteroidota bacterium]
MRKTICLFILVCASLSSKGQCSISTARIRICKGDIISFSFQGAKTVTSYQWFFGTGQSSVQASPSASYQNTGDFMVKCEVTYVDGTTCSDSTKISVFDLPVANLAVDTISVFCESENIICVNDLSNTPSGNSIATRQFIWGDGAANLNVVTAQKCHHFTDFSPKIIRLEVTDSIGCSSTATTTVSFRSEPEILLSVVVINEDCYGGDYCAILDVPNYGIASVKWQQNGQSVNPTSNRLCFSRNQAFSESFKIDVEDDYGCRASVTSSISRTFKGQNGPAKIPIDTICFGDELVYNLKHLSSTADSLELIILSADYTEKFKDVLHPKPGENSLSIHFIPDTIGVHYFKIQSLNSPEGCGYFSTKKAWVRGPFIRARIKNAQQCVPRDTVGFFDASGYYLNSTKIGYNWDFGDDEADNTQDLNPIIPYYNYGFSTARNSIHFYPKLGCYQVSFNIIDSVYGCTANANYSVTTGYPALTGLSILNKKKVYCEGDSVFFDINVIRFKDQSIDPAHKRLSRSCAPPSTLRFESIELKKLGVKDGQVFFTFETDKQCEPEDITLISGDGKNYYYPNGSKTPVYINDTVCYAETKYPDNIKVDNIPNVEFDVLTTTPVGCNQIRVAARIKSNEVIQQFKIKWSEKDSLVNDYGTLVMVDTIVYLLVDTGTYSLSIHAFSSCGCETTKSFEFTEGLRSSINVAAACGGQFFNINGIFNYSDESRRFTGSTDKESIRWKFDTLDWVNNINNIVPYDTFGRFPLYMSYSDYSGNCRDTLVKIISLKQVDARFNSTNETNICEKLIQFTDRSIVKEKGGIVRWRWDLDNNFRSTKKNPYQYYKDKGFYKISLRVFSEEGCQDTASKTINLQGPIPLFDFITDTIGCYPLKVGFVNKSKNAKTFLWEWNDHNGTIEGASLEQDTIYYSYTKAGLYYPVLRAFDTIYNGSNYYLCDDIYPNEEIEDPIRTVEVVDSVFLNFQLPNMLCKGEPIPILNVTGQTHLDYFGIGPLRDTFQINQGTQYITDEDTGFITFNFFAMPKPWSTYPGCSDTFSKSIYIDYVEAEFDHCVRFTPKNWTAISTDNKSNYRATKFLWKDTKDRLIYVEEDPKIRFYGDWGSGQRELCLEVESDFGCKDEICKIIEIPRIKLYNVFTPGNDGFNNVFDIDIEFEKSYHLKIYNRYGERVFESKEDAEGNSPLNWNGRHMNTGAKLPEGTYFYILKYSFDTCREKIYVNEGIVDIIR